MNKFIITKNNSKYGLLGKDFQLILPFQYDEMEILPKRLNRNSIFKLKLEDKYIIYNASTGETIVKVDAENTKIYVIDNFIIIQSPRKNIILNKDCKIIHSSDATKHSIEEVSELYGKDTFLIKNKETNLYGWIDGKGDYIFKEEYNVIEKISFYDSNYFVLEKGNKAIITNFKEKYEIPSSVNVTSVIYPIIILQKEVDGKDKYALYNFKQGKMLLPFEYDGMVNYENLIKINKDNKCGVYNTKLEKSILPVMYVNINVEEYDDFIITSSNTIKKAFNQNGKELLSDCEFISYLECNMLLFVKKDVTYKYFLLCLDDNTVSQIVYKRIWYFQNGLCRVANDNGEGLINKKGEEVIPCGSYEFLSFSDWNCYFTTLLNGYHKTSYSESVEKNTQAEYSIINNIEYNEKIILLYRNLESQGLLVKSENEIIDYPDTSSIKFFNVGRRHDDIVAFKIDNNFILFSNWFLGDLEAFKNKIIKSYGIDSYEEDYKGIIEFLEKNIK